MTNATRGRNLFFRRIFMALNVKRIAMMTKKTTDRFQSSFACSKPLDGALEFLRKYLLPKETKIKYTGYNYHDAKPHVVNDRNVGYAWEIQLDLGIYKLGNIGHLEVHETLKANLKYRGGVVYEVELNLMGYDAKAWFEDFKTDFMKNIEDVKGGADIGNPEIAVAVDFSGVTLMRALEAVDGVIDNYSQSNYSLMSFRKLKAFKAALTNKINSLPFQEKGKFSQPMSMIDTFINTLDGQYNNPTMLASIPTIAGTYVGQMKSAIGNMASLA